jgi:hypothetical protein
VVRTTFGHRIQGQLSQGHGGFVLHGLNGGEVATFARTDMTVFVYVNTSKQVGDADHIKVFANADAAETWLEDNDPEGVAFEYDVLE